MSYAGHAVLCCASGAVACDWGGRQVHANLQSAFNKAKF